MQAEQRGLREDQEWWATEDCSCDTSGLLMIAKKRSMLRHLHTALRGDGVDKRYMALVRGNWASSIKSVRAPLQKSNLRSGERMVEVNEEGKEALTLFRVLRRFGATRPPPARQGAGHQCSMVSSSEDVPCQSLTSGR